MKIIGISIIVIGLIFAWVLITIFREYLLNILRLKLDWFSITIVGGFAFMTILVFLFGMVFLIPGEYILTDSELIMRTWGIIKYAEQRIPYSDIERAFLYITWDFRGREQYLVLIKRYGELNVDLLYPLRGTLLLLNMKNPRRFIHDISSLMGTHENDEHVKLIKIDKVASIEGRQFGSPILITLALLFALAFLFPSPILLIIAHLIAKPEGFATPILNYFDLIIPTLIVFIIAIVVVPVALDTIQHYVITKEGLYIRKLYKTIFIPRNIIKGFIYMDIDEKSGKGGGLLKIGNMATMISVKNFDNFLKVMKQYGYKIVENTRENSN